MAAILRSPRPLRALHVLGVRLKPRGRLRAALPVAAEPSSAVELCADSAASLGWGGVCAQLAAFTSTSGGRTACESCRIPFGADRLASEILLEQTAAASALTRPVDFSGVDDVASVVSAAAAGELLGVREICFVGRTLRGAMGVYEQLVDMCDGSDSYYPLHNIIQGCDFLADLAERIEFCVDCGLYVVLDRASKKLESIRMRRKSNIEKLETMMKVISMKVTQAGGIDSPLVTKRRGRMCVGVKASHKALLPDGIVLSTSSSGATYFMEPRDAIELNNMEVTLLGDEKGEELAVLSFLTSEIGRSETQIRHLLDKIVELDLACARGLYSVWLNGVCPAFSMCNVGDTSHSSMYSVDIDNIQHPLLVEPFLRKYSVGRTVEDPDSTEVNSKTDSSEDTPGASPPIPLDFKISSLTKIVVISGPNTGGKTATMKTLGLASLMSKAGIFLSCKGTPRLPWFDQILADIGDHQSLEHSLSTFSGHILRLREMIEVATENSLILIDEIGCGTDPLEGVALSTSILKHLAGHVKLAVVTTHYADLSCLKDVDSRFENAAMEFSLQTLQPTYRILWGDSGNSNALRIAQSIGFDQKVLDRAKEWVEKLRPDSQTKRQALLYASLMEERNILECQTKEAASILSEVKQLYGEILSEAEDLVEREATLKAKESLIGQQELMNVKSRMDLVVRTYETKLSNSDPSKYNSIMREAEAAISVLVEESLPSVSLFDNETENQVSYQPKVGDKVYVKGLGSKLASVIEAPREDNIAVVQYGKIKVRAKTSEIKLVEREFKDKAAASFSPVKRKIQANKTSPETNKDAVSFGPAVRTSKNTIDLRGMRVEEASQHLQMAILGCKSLGVLFILHGMGTGAVKECALNILKNHPRVVKFEEESPFNYGCTVAYIN